MAERLKIYNEALRLQNNIELANLSENREARRVLDGVWNDGLIDTVLEHGLWNHATRTVKLDNDASATLSFGYAYAFVEPTDYIRTAAISADEYLLVPLENYIHERGYWFADLDEIYLSYISNDAAWGGDLSIWPDSFTRYVGAYLAHVTVGRLANSNSNVEKIQKEMEKRLLKAQNVDAMNQASPQKPLGSWSRARLRRSHADLGSRTRLTG